MRRLPVLMYHWFRTGDRTGSRSPQLEITPDLFDRHMTFLKRRGYQTVSLEYALGGGSDGRLPERPIVITFDDGTADFWDHARPVLRRHGFTATLFVVSGYVGTESSWDADLGEPARPLMSWSQLATLREEGFEIGSHTDTHRPLTGLEDDEARHELVASRQAIEQRLGLAPALLAYPRGFHEARHKSLARETGYSAACAVILEWGDLWRSDRYAIRRMTIKGTESMLRFRLRLAASGWVRHAETAG